MIKFIWGIPFLSRGEGHKLAWGDYKFWGWGGQVSMGSGVRPEGPLEQFQRVTDKLARIAGMSCGAVLE